MDTDVQYNIPQMIIIWWIFNSCSWAVSCAILSDNILTMKQWSHAANLEIIGRTICATFLRDGWPAILKRSPKLPTDTILHNTTFWNSRLLSHITPTNHSLPHNINSVAVTDPLDIRHYTYRQPGSLAAELSALIQGECNGVASAMNILVCF